MGKNCRMQFTREAKLIFHQTKCKSGDEKKTENGGTAVVGTGLGGVVAGTGRTIPDLIAIDKKLSNVLNVSNVNEETIDSIELLGDNFKITDRDSVTSSPVPSDSSTPAKKTRGRPRKAVSKTPNHPTPEPPLPVVESLSALPVRSMSSRPSSPTGMSLT